MYSYHYPAPLPRGVCQRLQTRGGERWPGHDLASEMRCEGPAVQAAPVLACRSARRGPVTAGRRTVLRSQECRRMPGPKDGGVVTQQVSPSRGGADHRGGCGASLKHRARDALGLADLRHALPIARTRAKGEAHRTSTSLDVARRRGPWVLLDPWRPARPRFFFRAMRIFPNTTAYPAPQTNRAAERWLFEK